MALLAGLAVPLSRRSWLRTYGFAAAVTVFLLIVALLAYTSAHHTKYAVAGAVGLMALGLVVTYPRFLPMVAIPGSLLVLRIGSGASGLSVADFLLFLATLSALPLFRLREAPEVGKLLTLLAIYESGVVLAVLYNPYRSNIVEWIHEAFLVGGSLIIGWVVGRTGGAGRALGAYLVGSCVIAIWTCINTAAHHFSPAGLPYGMQKNFIGDMLSFAVVLAYARPDWTGWRPAWTRAATTICLFGLLASQSKQAMISLAVGVLVVAVRNRLVGRSSRLILFSMVPLLLVAIITIQHEAASSNKFNSVHQRQTWYSQSFQLWHHSTWFGVGLRWWYTFRFPISFQPPNAELEMLTSAGVVGVAVLLILLLGALWVLRRVPPQFGTIAFAVVLMRLVQGQFDIFWVAAQGSICWIITGVALGALAADRARGPSDVAIARAD